jgi:hypothetical protein
MRGKWSNNFKFDAENFSAAAVNEKAEGVLPRLRPHWNARESKRHFPFLKENSVDLHQCPHWALALLEGDSHRLMI